MTAQRRFSVGEWGTAHLGPDAVVAFVDDELAARPHERAVTHVESCPECAAEIRAQRRARSALRAADCPALPSALLSALRSIPQDTDLPAGGMMPGGLAMTPDGEMVTIVAPPVRIDAAHGRRPGRRVRFGAGVAASGLAIGALTFGAVAVPTPTPAGPGVFGGSVLAPAAGAAFGVDPARPAAGDALARATRQPRTFLRER